jgi:anti-sigma factor RsiW
MTTPIDRQQLDAFVDGELDLKSQLAFERQLDSDAALRRRVEETRQLREAVREKAAYHAAPDALRQRLAATRTALPQPRPAAPAAQGGGAIGLIGERVQRWFGWRPLAASLSFATVLAVAVDLAWLQSPRDDRLSEEVLASHVRATLGQHLVDVASSDHHTVKPFLSSKLGFSPPVDELQLPGSVFLGGRVDYLDGRTVAALVYRQGEHVVNSFVWPGHSFGSKPRFSAERGYLTAHWSRNGMNHWVISDVNRTEFEAVVGAIVAADTDR